MKYVDTLASLLNRELGQNQLILSRIDVPISQGDEWIWVFCYLEQESLTEEVEQIYKLLLEQISPLHSGEILGYSGDPSILISKSDWLPEKVDRDDLLSSSSEISISSYVSDLISSMDDGNLIFFFRLKKESMLDADIVSKALRERTWFQSKAVPFYLRNRSVDISVGASRAILRPHTQNAIWYFETDRSFYAIFERNDVDSRVRCNAYQALTGVESLYISREDFLEAINFPYQSTYGFNIGIPLEIDTFTRSNYSCSAEQMLIDIKSSLDTCQKCREIIQFQLNLKKQETLRRLEQRRNSLSSRASILYNDNREIFLGYEPTNETELIILAAKLETYIRQYIGEFQILEHTSQLGIDGLIRIRRTASSVLQNFASAEFEYELRNFFEHEHPVEQTDYIICWIIGSLEDGKFRFRRRGIRSDGAIEVYISSEGWMKILTFRDHMIYVLPLKCFPGLVIR